MEPRLKSQVPKLYRAFYSNNFISQTTIYYVNINLMDALKIKSILESVKSGKITPEEAYSQLKNLPFEDIGFAKVDHHRTMRKGFPEVIYCEGKTTKQIIEIIKKLAKHNHSIMATRANKEVFKAVKKTIRNAVYFETAKIISVINPKSQFPKSQQGRILIITAGTADIPVAEEAAVTAELLGNSVERLFDVGVAGIHRLFNSIEKINSANVLIVVAGMEGALASVVSGLVDKPVIAVPTSIGYGASFKGLAALLAMMNSCSPGIAVVNIDNGFGAGCMAHLINQMTQ